MKKTKMICLALVEHNLGRGVFLAPVYTLNAGDSVQIDDDSIGKVIAVMDVIENSNEHEFVRALTRVKDFQRISAKMSTFPFEYEDEEAAVNE